MTFIGCEIDPGHFEVACKRVEAYWQRTESESHPGQLFHVKHPDTPICP